MEAVVNQLVNGGGDQQRVARMTLLTPPANEEKTHGFALTIEPLREDGAHQLRFIAGQAEYASREIDGVDGILFGFTETGNPIDLRQNFQREANARLQVNFCVLELLEQEATAPDIVFRCCGSKWVENDIFSLEEFTAILTELLVETNKTLRLAGMCNEFQAEMKSFIRRQRYILRP
ncbi:hypothetical protein PR003_g14951 [Phytophthora rubi]|uniref:Uncharacterized protein n=1 Tax=Phytophthora rubi TaxID=129364 RepID=A0A6A4ET79_9STRA|nr:hypothetical protein PR003_g14951 [Phytophthora rubi]